MHRKALTMHRRFLGNQLFSRAVYWPNWKNSSTYIGANKRIWRNNWLNEDHKNASYRQNVPLECIICSTITSCYTKNMGKLYQTGSRIQNAKEIIIILFGNSFPYVFCCKGVEWVNKKKRSQQSRASMSKCHGYCWMFICSLSLMHVTCWLLSRTSKRILSLFVVSRSIWRVNIKTAVLRFQES